jgi:hypothetical protein
MVSIMVLGKLLVEPKTLGWENSQKSFEYGFENLGVTSTPLKCFQGEFGTNEVGLEGRRCGWFYKRHWCFFVVARNNQPV